MHLHLHKSEIPEHLIDYFRPVSNINRKTRLCIPERFCTLMVDDGWILRNVLPWIRTNSTPECLHPDTHIFIKNKDNIIKRITLNELSLMKWKEYKILSPDGWNNIINVWNTTKEAVSFDAGIVDKFVCSEDHRFYITKDTHRHRKTYPKFFTIGEIANNYNPNHKLIYKNLSGFFDSGVNTIIDITKIENGVVWKADLRHMSTQDMQKYLGKSPYEIALFIKDKTLRKFMRPPSNWSYMSRTHEEYMRKIIKLDTMEAIGKIDINKIIAHATRTTTNRYYNLDYDLGWAFGLYCAEGGFNSKTGYDGKITLHQKEADIANRFKNIIKDRFCVDTEIKKDKNSCAIYMQFNSASLYTLFTYLCPGKCTIKKLNIDYLLNTSKEFRQGLFDGYILGDGHITKEGRISVRSASKDLIFNFQIISSTLGIVTSVNKVKTKEKTYGGKVYKSYTSYVLWTNSYHSDNYNDENFLVRIKNYKKLNTTIPMIDIEVDGNNAFIVENGLISHNSVNDRFSRKWEYVYFFTKSPDYYFNIEAIKRTITTETIERYQRALKLGAYSINGKYSNGELGKPTQPPAWVSKLNVPTVHKQRTLFSEDFPLEKEVDSKYKEVDDPETFGSPRAREDYDDMNVGMGNPWDILIIPTKGIRDKHYASFNPALVEYLLTAGCPELVCSKCGAPKRQVYNTGGKSAFNIKVRNVQKDRIKHIDRIASDIEVDAYNEEEYVSNEKEHVVAEGCNCGESYTEAVVFDPFGGVLTTMGVAKEMGRSSIGIELSEDYINMGIKRFGFNNTFYKFELIKD